MSNIDSKSALSTMNFDMEMVKTKYLTQKSNIGDFHGRGVHGSITFDYSPPAFDFLPRDAARWVTK